MKELPIIFSTEMVRALLDGRKTQTRRIDGLKQINEWPNRFVFMGITQGHAAFHDTCATNNVQILVRLPKQPGDLLYVRESFNWDWKDYPQRTEKYYFYKASTDDSFLASGEHWKPSIHLPKWASRIWLKVTDIRVERLQDISEADAIAEGIELKNISGDWEHSPAQEFEKLWTRINGPESWNLNPFVWVISFEVLSKTGKPVTKLIESITV